MTATNHAIIGGIITASVANPLIAIPAAFISHFFLDALPHFGVEGDGDLLEKTSGKLFRSVFLIDSLLLSSLITLIIFIQPIHWPYILLGMFMAFSPDIVWGYRFYKEKYSKIVKPSNKLTKFHNDIQWGERHWGVYIEVVWFLIFGSVFYAVLF